MFSRALRTLYKLYGTMIKPGMFMHLWKVQRCKNIHNAQNSRKYIKYLKYDS